LLPNTGLTTTSFAISFTILFFLPYFNYPQPH
jgi:hypothetical protein